MTAPAPRCGRLDQHPAHDVTLPPGHEPVTCTGHVTTEGAQQCVCGFPKAHCRCDLELAAERHTEWWAPERTNDDEKDDR